MTIRFIILCLMGISLCSCRDPKSNKESIRQEELQEPLIRVNRNLAKQEDEDINNYIKRQGLTMARSGSGLRSWIQKEGTGKKAIAGMKATVKFKTSLLDGTVCYTSDSTGLETFVVDHDNVESGLHEGIKKLAKGGVAKFILPSHLAHGLAGDNNKIPSRSPVVYDIELIDLKE